MKTCFLTLMTPEIAAHSEEFAKNKLDYARFREYDFYCGHKKASSDWSPSWEKIPLINNFMSMGYDFIIWADMDCVMMDFNVNATKLLRDKYWLGACKEFFGTNPRKQYLCACLMAIRVNQTSKDFFRKVAELAETSDRWQHPWEQKVINDLLEETKFAGAQLWHPNEIGGGWPEPTESGNIGWRVWENGFPRGWHPGELLLHLGAVNIGWEERRYEYLNKYQHQVVTGPYEVVYAPIS